MKYLRIRDPRPCPSSGRDTSTSPALQMTPTGPETALCFPCWICRSQALASSVSTQPLWMLCSERISNSRSYRRMASSICSWMVLPPVNVVRREPATHALGLQVGIQSISELLVLGRVADEAGVELEGSSHSIRDSDVGDEPGGRPKRHTHAGRPQESCRATCKRVHADSGRPAMSMDSRPLAEPKSTSVKCVAQPHE